MDWRTCANLWCRLIDYACAPVVALTLLFFNWGSLRQSGQYQLALLGFLLNPRQMRWNRLMWQLSFAQTTMLSVLFSLHAVAPLFILWGLLWVGLTAYACLPGGLGCKSDPFRQNFHLEEVCCLFRGLCPEFLIRQGSLHVKTFPGPYYKVALLVSRGVDLGLHLIIVGFVPSQDEGRPRPDLGHKIISLVLLPVWFCPSGWMSTKSRNTPLHNIHISPSHQVRHRCADTWGRLHKVRNFPLKTFHAHSPWVVCRLLILLSHERSPTLLQKW